jgi:hypothetical protein
MCGFKDMDAAVTYAQSLKKLIKRKLSIQVVAL